MANRIKATTMVIHWGFFTTRNSKSAHWKNSLAPQS